MVSDALLKGLAAQAANMAKTELRHRHKLGAVLCCYFEGRGLMRMREMEKLAEELAGEAWLDSDRAKEAIFGSMSASATVIAPDAIVIVTPINDWRPTPIFRELPKEVQMRIFEDHNPRKYPEYFVAHDVLMSVAQTPERVLLSRQTLKGTLLVGEPDIKIGDQSALEGRLKMYGVEPPPEVKRHLDSLLGKRWGAN